MITMHPTRRVPGRLQTIAFALAALIAVVDQAAKAAARAQLDAPINLTPFLALRLGFNPGVTFGLFAGSGAVGRWALSAVASLIIGALLAWIWRTRSAVTALRVRQIQVSRTPMIRKATALRAHRPTAPESANRPKVTPGLNPKRSARNGVRSTGLSSRARAAALAA